MFHKLRQSPGDKAPGLCLRGGLVNSIKALLFAAPFLLLNAGPANAELTRAAWRDDSSFNQADPQFSPERMPRPLDVGNSPNGISPQNPYSDEAPPVPRRLRERERDPDHPRRHHLSPRPPVGPAHEELLPEREQIQRKLTSRYANPSIVRLVRTLSPQQGLEVYTEISGLIDARHLKPTPYDVRVKQAVKNLTLALENPAFLQANGLTDDPARLDSFRRDLLRLSEGHPINGSEDAYQALQWTMQAAERDAGIRPTAVIVEFIFGATESLDKYSAFVPAMGRSAPTTELEDHIVGIGVEIKAEPHGLLISHALPRGPAAEAGLKGGDVIESVNGQKITGATLDSAVDLLSGPAGSRVTLGVRRDERFAEVKLVRRRVEVHSVSEVKMLENNVGYIKLEKFAQNSSEECDQALWDLYRQGMKSLIVDVRGNPGGLLTTAIQLSDKFVPSGTIVATRGRDASDNMVEYAQRQQTWKLPLVVLVDENSASASEIFAAAVQENGRGLVVGRRTYGKGTVQTHFPLQSVPGTLRLTTAQFFSPTGRTMAGAGVEPDVRVEAELAGGDALYDRGAPLSQEGGYGREPWDDHAGMHRHEAAYRHGGEYHGGEYRREAAGGPDRAMAVAIETATSQRAIDLARAAGDRRDNGPARPVGR